MARDGRRSKPSGSTDLNAVSHPLRRGSEVAVINSILGGDPVVEGWAVIRAQCRQPHVYRVRFRGERTDRCRFVNPDWQADPERACALLRVFLSASTTTQFEDFFD